jgi:hypothetical protein
MTTRWLGPLAVALALSWSGPAMASSYFATAALLLDETRRSDDWMQSHYGDAKLAEILHQLSEARVKCSRVLLVPKEADRAHPHLLLALEASERAMAAALEGESKHFIHLVMQALDEERTFRAILTQENIKMPELDRSRR